MSKINKLTRINRKKYIYNHLEQIGFLDETSVNPFDITESSQKKRMLGNGETLNYAVEINGNPHYYTCESLPEQTSEILIPNDKLTYPFEVPGNSYAVVIGHTELRTEAQAKIQSKSGITKCLFMKTLILVDPISVKTNTTIKCIFVSHSQEKLPKYKYMSILRLHRVMLYCKTSNTIILFAHHKASSWILIDRLNKSNIICESKIKHTWTYIDDLLHTAYSQYAYTLKLQEISNKSVTNNSIIQTEDTDVAAMKSSKPNPFDYIIYESLRNFNILEGNESPNKKVSELDSSKYEQEALLTLI